MKTHWLWDSRLDEAKVRAALRNEGDPRFDIYAEKLLSRIGRPREVFHLMDKKAFCRQWPKIKRRMQKDRWLQNRVLFWQTIYEVVKDQIQNRGVSLRQAFSGKIPPQRMDLARQIRQIRTQTGRTQQELAAGLGVIQQYISRVESGRENLTVDSLARIAGALGRKLVFTFGVR